MAGRRARRRGAGHTVLPLQARRLSNTLSCWYCDYKINTFNDLLFSFGRCYARFLRFWFTIGVILSVVALLGVTVMLIWEIVVSFYLHGDSFWFNNLSIGWLFGIFPSVFDFSISIVDVGIIVFSTLISVVMHEFGHAIAAASVGVQIEYIAIFLAVLFPGAFVALNYDTLRSLPNFASLRIYCAGIWHNLVFSAVCGLTLFFLPLIFYPIYMHNEGPMVLGVPQTSTLSGYLSRGDVIVSVDGSNISNPYEWLKKMAQIDAPVLHKSFYSESFGAVSGRKGYCVPNSWVEVSKKPIDNQFSCLENQAAFSSMYFFKSNLFVGNSSEVGDKVIAENKYCLNAKDVVKLKKCGDGWKITGTAQTNCSRSEEEICMTPVQVPGNSWVEISYSSPYSSECLHLRETSRPTDSSIDDSESSPCGGSFVFVGDALSMARSIWLAAYRPRWAFFIFGSYITTLLEKILACTFRMSATLAFLNSLPVFFLDGEFILETVLSYVSWLNARRRQKVVRLCLIGATLSSIFTFSRLLYFIFAGLH